MCVNTRTRDESWAIMITSYFLFSIGFRRILWKWNPNLRLRKAFPKWSDANRARVRTYKFDPLFCLIPGSSWFFIPLDSRFGLIPIPFDSRFCYILGSFRFSVRLNFGFQLILDSVYLPVLFYSVPVHSRLHAIIHSVKLPVPLDSRFGSMEFPVPFDSVFRRIPGCVWFAIPLDFLIRSIL